MKSKVTALALLTCLFLAGCGRQPAVTPAKSTVAIDRKTFAMSLPAGWVEDSKDDMYDPDHFVMFENEESCIFVVFIGKQSAGMTVETVLEKQKEAYTQKITDLTTGTFNSWAKYQGEGVELNGKIGGALKYQTRIFGFTNSDNVCAVIEAATPADWKTYGGDYDAIRQSFNLK
jgi:hypothetical protein